MKKRMLACMVAFAMLFSFSYSMAAEKGESEQQKIQETNKKTENENADVTIKKLSEDEIPEALKEESVPTMESSLAALKADPAAVIDAPAQKDLLFLSVSYAQEEPEPTKHIPLNERYFGSYADLKIHIDESLFTEGNILTFSLKNSKEPLYQGTIDEDIVVPALQMDTGYALTFTSKANGVATSYAGDVRIFEKTDDNGELYLDIQDTIDVQIYTDPQTGIVPYSSRRDEVNQITLSEMQ